MKIESNGITKLASLGRISLQVIIKNYDSENQETMIVIPDDWIIRLNSDNFNIFDFSDSGLYYLTEIGWNDNKNKIKEVYENFLKFHPYTTEENSWTAYEAYAEDFIKKVYKNSITTKNKTL